MNDKRLLDNFKLVSALAPSSDVYNTDPDSAVINLAKYGHVTFLLFAVATTGVASIVVKNATLVDKTGGAAIAARYKKLDVSASPADTLAAAYTAITTSGFSTGTSETAVYAIEIREEDTDTTKPFVYLDLTESVNAPVIGACIAIVGEPGYRGQTLPTVLT